MVARKKRFLSVLVLLVAVFFIAAFRYANIHPNPFKISKMPGSVEDNTLLMVTTHISQTPRPDETFEFPIAVCQTGPVKSRYSGPLQYPFYCMTWESKLGQPLVDNQQGIGVPVYQLDNQGQLTEKITGYSKDCLLKTRVDYFYIDHNGKHHPYTEDIAAEQIQQLDIEGKQVPFIVRAERGTINRYIYIITMLVGDKSGHQLNNTRYWNNKLIFQLGGGSGIGFRQGKMRLKKVIERRKDQLKQGYAVIASTGNVTSYTYNMLLAEDTAVRVKRQFVARYGKPQYTIGVGGSGGGIQSYLLAQNHPNLLDGIIPQYSYPDMVSQTIYALDCDLIEHYFAIRDPNNENWQNWEYREPVLGLNHLNGFAQKYGWLAMLNQAMNGIIPSSPKGSSECINGWFGLPSLVNNPRMSYLKSYYSDELLKAVHWSYWQDMVHIYGTDEYGFALSTWDNVGVQYGLKALLDNKISEQEFLDLNRGIGSWKKQHLMQTERFFYLLNRKFPVWTSMWSRHNITDINNGSAPRHTASLDAIEKAYRYGQVFIGKLNVPVIDVRHYLEESLDMHHVSATFASRQRMASQGLDEQHLIWMSREDFDYTNKAFVAMDQWINNIQNNPSLGVAGNKPQGLSDQCADGNGKLIAQGPNVWDGQYNGKAQGQCTQLHPVYTTSRIQAGGTWAASTFKCKLQSVAEAMQKGLYGKYQSNELQTALEQIFPDGVCDYTAGDAGRPKDI